jgi:hypothetical protein
LPNLKSLTFSSNHLKTFEIPSATDASDTNRPSAVDVPHAERRERWFPNLQELNLDWNDLDDWSRLEFLGELAGCVDRTLDLSEDHLAADVCRACLRRCRLRTLSLSNNRLPSLPLAVARGKTDPISFLPPKLETLRLARNAIDSWSTVDLLNERLGSLRVLWLGDNPLTAIDLTPRGGERVDEVDEEEAERRERRRVRDIRAGVIARVRGLMVLNGSEVGHIPVSGLPSLASSRCMQQPRLIILIRRPRSRPASGRPQSSTTSCRSRRPSVGPQPGSPPTDRLLAKRDGTSLRNVSQS